MVQRKVAIAETDCQEKFQNKMIEREPQANHLWLPSRFVISRLLTLLCQHR